MFGCSNATESPFPLNSPSPQQNNQNVKIEIGKPLLDCMPFSHILFQQNKEHYCDLCLKGIEEEIDPCCCSNCQNAFYCSEDCRQSDLQNHSFECRCRLRDKMQQLIIDDEYNYLNNFDFKLEFFLNIESLIDYTMLFFRVLNKARLEYENNGASFDNLRLNSEDYRNGKLFHLILQKRSPNYNQRLEDCMNEQLNQCLERLDLIENDEELLEFDREMGIALPDNQYFHEMVLQRQISRTLEQLIESAVNMVENEIADYGSLIDIDELADDDGEIISGANTNTKTSPHAPSSVPIKNNHPNQPMADDELFDWYVNQLKEDKQQWNKIMSMPYEKSIKHIGQLFCNYKKSMQMQVKKMPQRPQTNLPPSPTMTMYDELIDHDKELEFYNDCMKQYKLKSNPNNYRILINKNRLPIDIIEPKRPVDDQFDDNTQHCSKKLKVDPEQLRQSKFESNRKLYEAEEKRLFTCYQMMYRIQHLENVSKTNENQLSECEYYYSYWLNVIHSLLDDSDVRHFFSPQSYSMIASDWLIEKALYVTIRYSITILDSAYITSLSRAVYLSLSPYRQSCIPNTAALFDGLRLKLFYMPSSSSSNLDQSLLNRQSLITLKSENLSFDFQFDCAIDGQPLTLYLTNKFRMISCHCERCTDTERVQSDRLKLIDFFKHYDLEQLYVSSDRNFDQEDLNMDDVGHFDTDQFDLETLERMQLQLDEDQFPLNDESMNETHGDQNSEYSDLRLFKEANSRYGNRPALEYCAKIQIPLENALYAHQQLFGRYHPRSTALLLISLYSRTHLIQKERQPIIILYRCWFAHLFLMRLIDSAKVTHGIKHRWILIFESFHSKLHELMVMLFSRCSAKFVSTLNIEEKQKSKVDSSFFELANCRSGLRSLKSSIVEDSDLNSVLADEYVEGSYDEMDYFNYCRYDGQQMANEYRDRYFDEEQQTSDRLAKQTVEKLCQLLEEAYNSHLFRFDL